MSIQTTYRRDVDDFQCGQIANTLGAKCESGVLVIPSAQNTNTTLPFGRACRWSGPNEVNTGSGRRSIGVLGAAFSTNTMTLNLHPGMPTPSIGTIVQIGSETDIRVTASASDGTYTTTGRSSNHAQGDEVFALQGGPTSFAGVAVRDVTISASNPADQYVARDIVNVGSMGDFVVEVADETAAADKIKNGDPVGVYVGTAESADYGKFVKKSDAFGTNAVIGIPDAIFLSAAQTVDGKLCAIMRLTRQST